jgi:hypothetical protein
MKQVGRFVAQVMACGFAVAAASLITAQAEQGSAKVQGIPQGTAQYSTGGGWQDLAKGSVLSPGSTVKTDAEGIVDLQLKPTGSTVRVEPSTTFTIGTLTCDDTGAEKVCVTELTVASGRVLAVAKKSGSMSRFTIKTQTGLVTVKEGWVDVSASGRASAIKGIIEVKYNAPGAPAPTMFTVKGNETFEPTLNNNQGGVIRTPGEDQNWAIAQLNSAVGMGGAAPMAKPIIKNPEQSPVMEPTREAVSPSEPVYTENES